MNREVGSSLDNDLIERHLLAADTGRGANLSRNRAVRLQDEISLTILKEEIINFFGKYFLKETKMRKRSRVPSPPMQIISSVSS